MFGRERLELEIHRRGRRDASRRPRRRSHVEYLREACREGVTTGDLDRMARQRIEAEGARPSFPEVPGYRHTLCVSVGPAVVHGIPGEQVLAAGDLVSIDCGAIRDGWHGDAAISVLVGGAEATGPEAAELVVVTERSLHAGIAAMRPGNRVGDIGAAVEERIDAEALRTGATYDIVDQYEGHGIGREMHMEPGVPNVAVKRRGPKLAVGATLAIEPMVTLGSAQTRGARRRLDRGDGSRLARRARRAHGSDHTRRHLGADGPRLRRAAAHRDLGAPYGPLA